MSAIADFRLVETSRLAEIKEAAEIKIKKGFLSKKTIDNYWSVVNSNSRKLRDFNASGYIFSNLLTFLQEKRGIKLMNGKHDNIANEIAEKRQNATFIFTYDHTKEHLNDLVVDNFSTDELIAFNKEFSAEDGLELAEAEMEGIKALRENLKLIIDDNHVVMLTVG